MATLGTQNISTSYPQLLKVSGNTPFTSTLLAIATGDESSVSALQISTLGVSSSGTLNSVGATTLASSLAVTGAATFSSSISATTGTATIGTIASTTISNTGIATVGTLEIGATGPNITKVSFGTAAFTSATVAAHNGVDTTTGTFTLTGAALGDIVFGSLNSLGSATGTVNIGLSLYPQTADVVRYSIQNQGATAGTIPAGIFFATAMRFTT